MIHNDNFTDSFRVCFRGFIADTHSLLKLQDTNRVFQGITRLTYFPHLVVVHLHMPIKAPQKNSRKPTRSELFTFLVILKMFL